MKTRFLLLSVAVLPLLGGCTSANSETERADTNVAVQTAPAVMPAVTTTVAPPPQPEADMPASQPVNTEVKPPTTVKLSPAATEIAKLVQAGVDSSVVLAYVTNSRNTFRLEADELVYLNDIGMSPTVVAAMINRDQQLRGTSVASSALVEQAAPSVSAWQQDVNAPAPAAQPSTATTVPPPPTEEAPSAETVNYFYDDLAPYGTWVDVEGYGRSWRPTVVATTPGWRPYSNSGRWEWTDRGWYWYSDYSWGWAPFHYGRWYSHPRWGWCWMPGSEWAPSWVSWRYSDAHCGWAPLPPAAYYSPSVGFTYFGNSCGSSFSFGLTWDCFTFVSYHNFRSRRYDRDCVPHHQAGQVFNNTTVVNNIIRGNNNTIINQGIAPTRITAGGGGSVRQVTVQDTRGPRGGRTTRNEEIAQDGRSLHVVRANVPTGRANGPVRGPGNPRGGSQQLTSGNTLVGSSPAPAAPAVPQAGLVPPPIHSGGPRNTPNPRHESSAPATPVVQAPLSGSPAAPVIRGTTPPIRGHANESASTPRQTREQNPPGAVIIRNPRGQNQNPVPTGPTIVLPSAPSSPAATVVAATPIPPRNGRLQGSAWGNNSSTPESAPSGNESSGGPRSWPTTRNDVHGGNNNNNTRLTSPGYVAPSAPAYQAPATPRVQAAPAQSQPAQHYTPPTRSPEPRYTPAPSAPSAPASQPAYTAPPRQSAPSQSSPPPSRSETRSSDRSDRSEPRGSTSGSSSRSNDDRPSRGR